MQTYIHRLWSQVREALHRAIEWIVEAHARQAELCLQFETECEMHLN